MTNQTTTLDKQLRKLAHVRKSTRGSLFIQTKERGNEDHNEAIELLLATIYGEYDGIFGTYTIGG